MWLMDLIQETMREMLIEWTLHNFIVFSVITSSSVISVVGAVRHIYVYTQKVHSVKLRTPVSKAVVRKRKKDGFFYGSFVNDENKDLSHSFITERGRIALVKDSMLYQKLLSEHTGSASCKALKYYILTRSSEDLLLPLARYSFTPESSKVVQRVKENLECLQCLQCDCEAPMRKCPHNLCKRCCSRSGWCRRKMREFHSVESADNKLLNVRKPYHVQLSNRCLDEVPHRLGFHCMTATSINLSRNVLFHLPEHMALIRQLEKVDLSHNLLKTIPAFFSSYQKLYSLDLKNNSLTAFPETLLELGSLCKLFLDNNNISHVPRNIYRLQNLSHLGLGYNSISEVPPLLFKIHGLQLLRLCGNSKLTSLPHEIYHAFWLEVLDVSDCSLKCIPPSIGSCSKLKHLILSNNRLTFIPEEISHCFKLVHLNVSKNPLTSLPAPLLFCSSQLSLSALCSSFPVNPKSNVWHLLDAIPDSLEMKSAVPLFNLALASVKHHNLDISELPFDLKEELTSFSGCYYCGYKTTGRSLRVIRWRTFGSSRGLEYPFLHTVCLKHIQLGSEEKVLAQINALCYHSF